MYTTTQLARLTRLPNLEDIARDWTRLERAARTADSMARHFRPDAPLRYKVAAKEYADRAYEMLRNFA